MFVNLSRREFVSRSAAVGTAAVLGELALLGKLRPVQASEARKVQLCPDVEPLARLIEDTPRNKLLEAVAGEIRRGVSYQQLLSALFLAGVRSIQPRPVGFKFHAVLVVNSAHLASLASPDSDRWLPLFWALDNFKGSQARNAQEGNWSMPPVAESKLPAGPHARQRFVDAMENWDEDAADAAIAALVRHATATEVIELFWRYGARDFRDIGHKAIFVANSWRTLQTIGWRHAEPVMRSLAYALLEHEGDNPARRDDERDRPWRENLVRAARIRTDWRWGKVAPEATRDLLQVLRWADASGASEEVLRLLNRGVAPQSIWDGLFLTAGELLMRQPGIIGLHCVTSINALHYAYQTTGNDETRRMMPLQAAAFLTLFRKFMLGRGRLRDELAIDTLEPVEPKNQGATAVEEIFADVSKDRLLAARKTLAAVQAGTVDPDALMTAARRLVFLKGTDSHDYKFSSAALEDFYHTTPRWQARFLATSLFNLRGSGDPDNGLIQRARSALGTA